MRTETEVHKREVLAIWIKKLLISRLIDKMRGINPECLAQHIRG